MTNFCPNCGSGLAPESRFCRRCGSALPRGGSGGAGVGGDSELVSPIAATIPLTDAGRTTDDLDAHDASHETSRVNRTDLEALLRQSASPSADLREPRQPDAPETRTPQFDQQTIASDPTPPSPRDLNATIAAAQTSTLSGANATPEQDFASTLIMPGRDIGSPAPITGGGGAHDDEEDLTVVSAKPEAPNFGAHSNTAARVVPSATFENFAGQQPQQQQQQQQQQPALQSQPQSSHQHAAAHAAPPSNVVVPRRAGSSRALWVVAAGTCVFLALVTAAVVWFAFFRRPAVTESNINANVATTGDAKQQFDEKLAEAEALLASGDLDGAIARLREANALDPANTAAHRRLGGILLDNGQRREAIEEFRAVTASDPQDAAAWRALARAQGDEGLHADAAASYKRLIALSGEASLNDNENLSYADALRLSENEDEARTIYQRLASSTLAEVSAAARQRLTELDAGTSPTPSASPGADLLARNRRDGEQNPATQTSPTPAAGVVAPTPNVVATPPPPPQQQPTPVPASLTAGEHFARGENLWRSNRGAALSEFRSAASKGSRDAYYYLGLAAAEGRDPKTMSRAELVSALQSFQNARGSRFGSQARQYEDRLGKEFDRRRQEK